MNELQQSFLAGAPRRIENLRADLRRLCDEQSDTRANLQSFFRQIHTLKGAAAAFEFETANRIAHEIENLLEMIQENAVVKIEQIVVLQEAVSELENALANPFEPTFPVNKIELWREICADSNGSVESEFFAAGILPSEIALRLNAHEVKQLKRALIGKTSRVYLIGATFSPADLAEKFPRTRSFLAENGEIISTLPVPEIAPQIGLQTVFVSATDFKDLKNSLGAFGCEVLFASPERNKPSRNEESKTAKIKLSEIWMTGVLAAERAAKDEGKKVVFDTSGGEYEVGAIEAECVETALLHLLRNAVVHGIEPPEERRKLGKKERGVISIKAFRENGFLNLTIADDGRGIDHQKIARTAVERGLIDDAATLDAEQALKLIFMPGFSTAASLTNAAGRGIGLDAVESALREIGGKIEVSSEPNCGAVFKLRLKIKN